MPIKHSDDTREMISQSLKGHDVPLDVREKISARMKGNKNAKKEGGTHQWSVRIDAEVLKLFKTHCDALGKKYSPTVEELIRDWNGKMVKILGDMT